MSEDRLLYLVRHGMKNSPIASYWDGRDRANERNPRQEFQYRTIAVLLALRGHPEYLEYTSDDQEMVPLTEAISPLELPEGWWLKRSLARGHSSRI